MIYIRKFKYKLKAKKPQREDFLRFAGAARFVFNLGLERRQTVFEKEGRSLSYFEQNKELTHLKEAPETSWMEEIHSQVLQQSLKDLNSAFQHFFRKVKSGEKKGFPRFKKKGEKDSFRFPQGVKVEGAQVYLPKIGWVKFRKSRELPGEIKETTIIREGDDWFVSFTCEWEKADPKPAPINEERAIGIDVGLTHFATMAAGTENIKSEIDNPGYLKKHLSRLRYLSRQFSKKQKQSKNRIKARGKLSKLHARIKNLRDNFAHQLSAEMIKNHDIFCVESLDISSLLQKNTRGMARAISDASWRLFLRTLKYKAEAKGKHFVEAGKYFASSQTCSDCLHVQKMPLSVRIYKCLHCREEKPRDYNSAIVIKAVGMSVLKACGAALTIGS